MRAPTASVSAVRKPRDRRRKFDHDDGVAVGRHLRQRHHDDRQRRHPLDEVRRHLPRWNGQHAHPIGNADGDHRQRNRHLLEGGSNAITLAEAAKVVTTGTGAEAIVLGNDRTPSIAVGASVATAGRRPRHPPRNNATISNAGAIATQGDGAYGISLYGSGSTLTHSGSISTEGESAYGVYSNDGTSTGNTITLEDGSTIATTGSQAHGVYLGQYSSLFVESGASISAQTESAHGIDAATHTTIEVAGAIESVAVGLFAADATNVAEGVKHPGQGRGIDPDSWPDLYHWAWHLSWRLRQVELESGTSIATEGEEFRRDQYGHERPDRECRQHKDEA